MPLQPSLVLSLTSRLEVMETLVMIVLFKINNNRREANNHMAHSPPRVPLQRWETNRSPRLRFPPLRWETNSRPMGP